MITLHASKIMVNYATIAIIKWVVLLIIELKILVGLTMGQIALTYIILLIKVLNNKWKLKLDNF